MDNWQQLWFSTVGLYRRFGILNELPESQRRKLVEEILETCTASIKHEESINEISDDHQLRSDLSKEIIDSIVVLFGLAILHKIQYREIEDAVRSVAKKNDIKDNETHVVYNGMITKRSKLMEIKTNDS